MDEIAMNSSNTPQCFDIDTTLFLLEITAHRRRRVISPQCSKVLYEVQQSMTMSENTMQTSEPRTQIYTAAELELMSLSSSGPRRTLEEHGTNGETCRVKMTHPPKQKCASEKTHVKATTTSPTTKQRTWSHLGLCHRHMHFWYRLRAHCVARQNMENMHLSWRRFLEQHLKQRLGDTCFHTVMEKCPTNDDWVRWWLSRAQLLRRQHKRTCLYHTCFPISLVDSPWLVIALRFFKYCQKWEQWKQSLAVGCKMLQQQLLLQQPCTTCAPDEETCEYSISLHPNKANPLLDFLQTLPEFMWMPHTPHPSNDFLRMLKLYHKSICVLNACPNPNNHTQTPSDETSIVTPVETKQENMETKLDIFYTHLFPFLESLEHQVQTHHQWTKKHVLPLIPLLCHVS